MIAVSYIQPSVWHLSDPDPPSVLLSLPCPFSLALSLGFESCFPTYSSILPFSDEPHFIT